MSKVLAHCNLPESDTLDENDECGTRELFNGALTWNDAVKNIDVGPIPEYRPTPFSWLNDSSGRLKRSS